jgi:hypothetical protein
MTDITSAYAQPVPSVDVHIVLLSIQSMSPMRRLKLGLRVAPVWCQVTAGCSCGIQIRACATEWQALQNEPWSRKCSCTHQMPGACL